MFIFPKRTISYGRHRCNLILGNDTYNVISDKILSYLEGGTINNLVYGYRALDEYQKAVKE